MSVQQETNAPLAARREEAAATPDAVDRAAALRAMAADLLSMASQLDPEPTPIIAAARRTAQRGAELIDKGALLERAGQDYDDRRQRRRYLSADLFGEPAWDLLLDLFQARLEDKMITVTSACIAADVPLTTALRWIGVLEQQGLVERSRNVSDQRSIWVRLSDTGMQAMLQYTEGCLIRARRAERLAERAKLAPIQSEAA